MASAAWGEQVAVALAKDLAAHGASFTDGDARELKTSAMSALMSLEPGSERRARDLALRSWKRAADDVGRGSALAIVALALVLDPTVDGYGERLVDAAGLAIYAGTVDASDSVGQCARAVVGAAAGSVRQARDLIKVVDEIPKLPDDVRGWLAIARDSTRDRSDALYADAAKGLAAQPDNIRLHALVADHLLELGLVDAALRSLGQRSEAPLLLLRARAQLAQGDAAGAVALLSRLSAQLLGVDEPRRAETLFWLGLAQLDVANPAGPDLPSSKATITALEPRPGWAKEVALLNAIVARREGRYEDAKKLLLPLTTGTPTSTLVMERLIVTELLDACAEFTKDPPCVEKMARRLSLLDVDLHQIGVARARVLITGPESLKPGAGSPVEMMAEASRLAPGDAPTQAKLRSVRRALAAKAPSLATPVLDELVKNPELRVARALKVQLARDPPETARAAAAAVTGLGPPLAESDLVDVLVGLGAFKIKDSANLLALFDKDPRPTVQHALQLARNDLKDPDSRRKRLATDSGGDPGQHTDHEHAPSAPGRTLPPPGISP